MIKFLGALLAFLVAGTVCSASAQSCPNSGERTQGFNKICYYQCLSGTTTRTISSVSLCPISIQEKCPSPLNLGQIDLSDFGGSGRIEDGSEAVFR